MTLDADASTDSDAARNLATAAAIAIVSDQAVIEHLVKLLIGLDLISSSLDVFKARDHFAAAVRDVVECIVPDIVRYADGRHFARIRRFLLDPDADYSMQQLAAIWRITADDVRLVFHDELAAWQALHPDKPSSEFRVAWANAAGASRTFNLLRPHDVDVALGDDFDAVRSDKWRTVPVLIRLPRFITDSISSEGSLLASYGLAARVENFILEMYQDEYRTAWWRK